MIIKIKEMWPQQRKNVFKEDLVLDFLALNDYDVNLIIKRMKEDITIFDDILRGKKMIIL